MVETDTTKQMKATGIVERLRKSVELDLGHIPSLRRYLDADSVLHHEAADEIERLSHTRAALEEARAQIEYLHEKFQETGSGNGVLARIDAALNAGGEVSATIPRSAEGHEPEHSNE